MSRWIDHVKAFQKKTGMSYKEAMSNLQCRQSYHEKVNPYQEDAPPSAQKLKAYDKRRQRGFSVDRLKTPMTKIGERKMDEFRKIMKVNRKKIDNRVMEEEQRLMGQEDVRIPTRGQKAEALRKTKPPVPRGRKVPRVIEPVAPKRTQPKLTPRGGKRIVLG